MAEGGSERIAVVVVTGHHVHRHWQRLEKLADAPVLARGPVLGEISGDENRVWSWVELDDPVHGRREGLSRSTVTRADAYVQVAQLRQQGNACGLSAGSHAGSLTHRGSAAAGRRRTCGYP
jgi:hypothetical protein